MNLKACACLLALFMLSACSAEAACRLQKLELPVRLVDSRPVATLQVNGENVSMLLDSGAFYSFLSATTAAQLKLSLYNLPFGMRIQGYTGEVDAKRTRVDRLGLQGFDIRDVEFLVGGNQLGAGIQGIMGRNILAIADTEYDLAHGVVRLFFPKGECAKTHFAYWAGEAPVVVVPLEPEDRYDTAIRLEVLINGKRTQAVMDTGAPTSALTLRAARRAGIQEGDLKSLGRVGGAGEGKAQSWTARVASFQLGGQTIENNWLQVDSVDHQRQGMLIGLDYFLSHRIYVSRLQQQIYITWNGKPVFSQGSDRRTEFDPSHAAVPQEVSNDDADALARRGAAALAAQQYDRALQDLSRAIELQPTVAQHRELRARVHLAQRSTQAALADLDQALSSDPAAAEARALRSRLRASLNDRAGALADLNQLDATLPAHAHLRSKMGRLHVRLGQPAEALRQFDLWVKHHPQDAQLPGMLNERCWLRMRKRIELPLALEDCKQAVAKDREEAAYRDSLGWTHLQLGEWAAARRAFDAAVKIKPLALSLYGRSLAHRRLGDAEQAEADLAAARKLNPAVDDEVMKEGLVPVSEPVKP